MLESIGADVEVFGMTDLGHHVALCGKIGGTKEEPKQVAAMPSGFMVQEDNVSLEFNIPPSYGSGQFSTNMTAMVKKVEQILKEQNLLMSKNTSFSFAEQELTHPNALVFGCEPDYDAWKMVVNKKPSAKDKNLRTCGGHIHVGSQFDMVRGVRNMDLFLGVPSVILDNSEEAKARKNLYGNAGAMRPKPYGWEYRVLSNYWIFSQKLIKWVYDQTYRSVAPDYVKELSAKEGKRIQTCINKNDEQEAWKIIEQYNIVMP